jgi:hypothetical protein
MINATSAQCRVKLPAINQTEGDDEDECLPRAVLYHQNPPLHPANLSGSRREARIIAHRFQNRLEHGNGRSARNITRPSLSRCSRR